jgi:hypothetical protein
MNNSGGGGGGGGGSPAPTYAQPNINYGKNSYAFGDTKLNASPYFISGDKGVYNLLPALGQINAGSNQMQYFPNQRNMDRPDRGFNKIGAQGSYTPYEAHQDILAQMANDPTALAAYNKAYSASPISTPNIKLPGGHNIPFGPSATSPLGQFYANTPNPYGQHVNYGLNKQIPGQTDLSYNKLANYAAENKNPFFLPYETTQGATPLGFTPSQSALAPVDTSGYLSGYNTAQTAQNQYIRDQRDAQQAQRQAQEQAQEQARRAQEQARRAQEQARDQARAQDRARDQAEDQQKRLQGPRGNQGIGGIDQGMGLGSFQGMGQGMGQPQVQQPQPQPQVQPQRFGQSLGQGMGQPQMPQGIAGIGQPPGMQGQPQVQPQRRNR